MADLSSVKVAKHNIQISRDGNWYFLWLDANEKSRSMELQTILQGAKEIASSITNEELLSQLT